MFLLCIHQFSLFLELGSDWEVLVVKVFIYRVVSVILYCTSVVYLGLNKDWEKESNLGGLGVRKRRRNFIGRNLEVVASCKEGY